jgi:hypothetical protein
MNMLSKQRTRALAVATVAVLAIVAGTFGVLAAPESSPGAQSSRGPGAWTRPDKARLVALRDTVAAGDGHFEGAVVKSDPTMSSYQSALLSDGNLTFDEYRQAEVAWVVCLAASGVNLPSPRLDGLGRFNKQILRFTNADEGQAARTSMDACGREYTTAVEFVWAGITAKLSHEVVLASRTATAACFSAAGYGPADTPWDSSDPNVQRAFSECQREVSAELDVVESFGMTGDGLSFR